MHELTINLRPSDKEPLYEQIYTYIKDEIRAGRILCKEKLPSTRALSSYLEVSRSTVELAYEQLLSEGSIESVPYRGFFVAQVDELYHLEAERKKDSFLEKKEESREQMEINGEKKIKYDFTPNGVDLKSFPYNTWRKLSREILSDDRTELFRLGDPRGEYEFRSVICRYLYQARGVNCTPEQVIVGAGSDYLMMLFCTIIGRDHVIAVENPTYKKAYRLFQSQEYKVMPVPMDGMGMKIDPLRKSGADIAYVTPSHQYPTGIVMPIGRRMELLKWAEEEEGRYIVEDDYDSEFRYKGKPIPALQGYDAHGKVVYLGTFSKSIAPAIRLSYMVLPPELCEAYQQKCRFLSSTVSKVDQLIVCRFIEEGYYERHLNKTRALYKSRHDQLILGLRPLAGQCRISGENAGVHLLLHFPGGREESELILRAAEEGIKVYGLSDYIVDEDEKREEATILLGYANMSEEKIKEACAVLGEIWKN